MKLMMRAESDWITLCDLENVKDYQDFLQITNIVAQLISEGFSKEEILNKLKFD